MSAGVSDACRLSGPRTSGKMIVMKSPGSGWKHVVICAVALSMSAAHAEVAPQAKAEIEYLLNYVEASRCEFFRNGTWYDAKKGRAHLSSKYEWLAARNLVNGAEDFIARTATKSSVSGRQYQVRCDGGAPQPSGPWLTAALARYRNEGSGDVLGASSARSTP